jgi:hypothetical protein
MSKSTRGFIVHHGELPRVHPARVNKVMAARVYVFAALAHGRAKLCDQALRKLMNIAQKGQNEKHYALERPSDRDPEQLQMLRGCSKRLQISARAFRTQWMLQAAAPAQRIAGSSQPVGEKLAANWTFRGDDLTTRLTAF